VGATPPLSRPRAALGTPEPGDPPRPRSRAKTIRTLAEALIDDLRLDAGADPAATREHLLSLPGIGPWTADYIAMRALRDPDAFLPTDLGVKKAVEALGHATDAKAIEELSDAWRPYRAYANVQLWAGSARTRFVFVAAQHRGDGADQQGDGDRRPADRHDDRLAHVPRIGQQ